MDAATLRTTRCRVGLRLKCLLVTICLVLAPLIASGQPDLADVEVDGLIIDKTLTRLGHDFVEEFLATLDAPGGIPGINIVLEEKVTAQWGSIVRVVVNERLVFNTGLRPGANGVRGAASLGARAVLEYLVRQSADGPLLEDPDLDENGL